jgi:CRP-like cAMP-binding protein
MDTIALLQSVPVFAGLEESTLRQFAAHLKQVLYPAGGEVFAEQAPADSFFIIESGEIAITKRLGPGQEKLLAQLGRGGVFGEGTFFADSRRSAAAQAKTAATLWKIDRADFTRFIMEQPVEGIKVLSGLLRITMERLEQTSRELATTYQAGQIISRNEGVTVITAEIIAELLLAVPEADHAAAYMYNEFNLEFDPIVAPATAKEIAPSHPMLAQMKERLCAVIYRPGETGFPHEDFISAAKSVLLTPLVKTGKILGFMLLWNERRTDAFKNNHALLTAAVANQLAEAAENIRYRQEERDRQRLNNAKQQF